MKVDIWKLTDICIDSDGYVNDSVSKVPSHIIEIYKLGDYSRPNFYKLIKQIKKIYSIKYIYVDIYFNNDVYVKSNFWHNYLQDIYEGLVVIHQQDGNALFCYTLDGPYINRFES